MTPQVAEAGSSMVKWEEMGRGRQLASHQAGYNDYWLWEAAASHA